MLSGWKKSQDPAASERWTYNMIHEVAGAPDFGPEFKTKQEVHEFITTSAGSGVLIGSDESYVPLSWIKRIVVRKL